LFVIRLKNIGVKIIPFNATIIIVVIKVATDKIIKILAFLKNFFKIYVEKTKIKQVITNIVLPIKNNSIKPIFVPGKNG
jgi:aspartokinase